MEHLSAQGADRAEEVAANRPLTEEGISPETMEVIAGESLDVAEEPHILVKVVHNRLAEILFSPKDFESIERYETLKVRWFKKYVPTSGDLVFRHIWQRFGAPDWVQDGSLQSLRTLETITRYWEAIHWGLLACGIVAGGVLLGYTDKTADACSFMIVALANIPPIALQRYNRMRLSRVIRRRLEAVEQTE